MRLHRRRRKTSTRRNPRPQGRYLPGRTKTLEVLESREMLAGDVADTPWHNASNPADVNFDQRVSPFDALVIVNDLLANGSHKIDMTATGPLAATSESSPVLYWDTSGDNRVTPFDLLIVVNELVDEELMLVHTFPTDMDDNPISTISVGTQFKLRTEVQDIRDPASINPGVASAAANVTFNPALTSIDTGQSMVFGDFFDLIQQSTLEQGHVVGFGAGQEAPATTDTQFLWSVVLTATDSGFQTFTTSFSTNIDHENVLLGQSQPILLEENEIQFVGATLEIIATPTVSIGDVTQDEDTGNFNFTVSITETASENVTVSYATSDGTGANAATIANDDYESASGTVTFTPGGPTTIVVPVTVNADLFVEEDEVFNVTLSDVSDNAEIGTAVGVGTILNDDTQATLAIGNFEQDEDAAGTFNFTVSISGEYSQNVTVEFATNDGAGQNAATVADNDYQSNSGTLTFVPGGATTMVIPVTVNADTMVEPDEVFNVVLSNSSLNATIGSPLGIGTILNDDMQASLSIESTTVDNVPSGTTTATFTVSLSEATSEPVTVAYSTLDNSAIAGQDYTATSGTLTFTPGGSLTETISVEILGDDSPDDVDTFLVVLSEPENASISVGTATGTINPAVSSPEVSVSSVTRQEGALGATTDFVFTVMLSGPSGQEAVVSFETADGTATVGNNDYVGQSQNITFMPGETSRSVTVQVVGDNTAEPTETFLVNVEMVSGSTGSDQGVGTIVDDDGAPTLTVSDANATPGTGATIAVFTVTLSGSITQPVTVGYATTNDTAIAGEDFIGVTGNLTFTPGGLPFQEIPVTVLGSSAPEPDKTFFMNLSSPTPGNVVIGDALGIGTIITQGLSISDAVVVEGNSGSASAIFTVTLSRMSSEAVTVVYATADDTATTADGDYVPTSGTLTFAPGTSTQAITVSVIGDLEPEGNERFLVNLSSPDGAPLFDSVGVGTILNDDGNKVVIRLELSDLDENPLSISDPLNVDDEFLLRVFIQDVSADATGVFQTAMDVTFASALVEPIGVPQFSSFYDTITSFTLGDGIIDDVIAIGELTPPSDPSAELLVFQIQFKAISQGFVEFVGIGLNDPDADPELVTRLYGPAPDTPVPVDEINILNRSINIGSNVLTVSNEIESESNNLVFSITRFLPDNNTATVVYSTADGTAKAGEGDYEAQSGTLTFVPGEPTTQFVTITVIDDPTDEPDETMSLIISNAIGATVGSPGTGTIVDNDGEVSVSANSPSAREGENLVFTVSLSAASGKQVTVNYTTANPASGVAATPGVDYTPISGTLTFAEGITEQLVTVALLEDLETESSETFQLTLSEAVNASLGTQGLGTIIDVPPAGISGFVFVDLNNNGIKEGNETGIAGATVTATRQSDGVSESILTGEDGSYFFDSLFPAVYTITETQPGFYTDGRDVHLGVEATVNDKYTGVVLESEAREVGYNFGEQGIRAEFIAAFMNRRALFASSVVGGLFGPTINAPGTTLNLQTGDIWVSFDGGWEGLRTVEALFDASQGSVSMKLYNNSLQEVALSVPTATGAVLLFNGQLSQTYFLRLTGSNPNVTVEVFDTVLPSNLAVSSGGGDGGQDGGSPATDSSNSNSDPFTMSRFASAASLMTAPESEPLTASDASDEAMAEDEDWLLDTLLA